MKDATKRFGDVSVLCGTSLKIGAGEVVALLGSSGVGKTTLARAVCGMIQLDSGMVSISGQVVGGVQAELGVSYMPQELGYWTTLTVRQQLTLALRSDRARFTVVDGVKKLVELVGLETRIDAECAELSGGELRRLALARAIAVDSRVLILDEPFSSVDVVSETNLQRVLRAYVGDIGCAVLMITHDFAHALLLAHRSAVMHAGNIIQDASPRELLKKPDHGAVARALGAHNVWDAVDVESLLVGLDAEVAEAGATTEDVPQTTSSHRMVYIVPYTAVNVGDESTVQVHGMIDAVIPGRGLLRVILRRNDCGRILEIGMRDSLIDQVKPDCEATFSWGVEDGAFLPDGT